MDNNTKNNSNSLKFTAKPEPSNIKNNSNNLRFIALSGTTDVTENLYVYEYGDDMMILDCGVGFPDLEMPGVELVIPDFSYIIKNKNKLKGVLVSQGHDDHVGALPFLLKQIQVPIWCTPLVTEFLKVKFKDYKVDNYKLNTFNPDRDEFDIGSFHITPFRVTHSVPDTVGFAIDTPLGRTFHVAEHKMDQESVDGMSFDIKKAQRLADEKPVISLMSDCLGSNQPGYTQSSVPIENRIYDIVKNAPHAVYLTAISSAIGRFQQMMNVAQRTNRKVVLVGRSVQSKIEIAYNLGYIKFLPNLIIDIRDASKYEPSRIMYIVAGCYGQPGSSVYRLSLNEHQKAQIRSGDTFIFSADPGPAYSKESQDFIVNNLTDLGVDVHYYDLHEGLHVSGHGGQEDIKELFKIIKPKYFIPTGGEIRYMKSYAKLAASTGAKEGDVFRLKPGETVVFDGKNALRGASVPVKEVMVHGLGIGDIGKVVLEDRTALGKEGVVAVGLAVDRSGKLLIKPEFASRGFVYEQKYGRVLEEASQALANIFNKDRSRKIHDYKNRTVTFLEKYFFDKTRRSPMIIPVIVEI